MKVAAAMVAAQIRNAQHVDRMRRIGEIARRIGHRVATDDLIGLSAERGLRTRSGEREVEVAVSRLRGVVAEIRIEGHAE